MLTVVQVKLLPSPMQAEALRDTMRRLNEAANQVSAIAFGLGVPREYELRRHVYGDLKASGLGAQAAQHVIKKVRDAYTALHAAIRAGRLGPDGSRRRTRAEGKPIAFRPDAAHPFDDRCLSWQHDAGTVSIWSTAGRLKGLRFTGLPEHLKVLATHRRGESDLVERDGDWYLYACCDVPTADRNTAPAGWIGVDLGIVNIATVSTDPVPMAGERLNRYRRRMSRIRSELQAKATKSAKRKLKARAKKEARYAANTNHVIAKQIVAEAERTGCGIALEDLTGIRDRVRLRKPQRATLHTWAFAQLGAFVLYKATRAGVPVVQVDPAHTSQRCSWCGHIAKDNRTSQESFSCRSCGVAAHADFNAARNIAQRARDLWAAVNQPYAAAPPQPVAGTSCEPGDSRLGS